MEALITALIMMSCIFSAISSAVLICLIIAIFKSMTGVKDNKTEEAPKELSKTEEELLERNKRKYIETEMAFQDMMNFNAYQAYGMNDSTKETNLYE